MDEATIKSMATELAKGLKTPEDLNQMAAVFKKIQSKCGSVRSALKMVLSH